MENSEEESTKLKAESGKEVESEMPLVPLITIESQLDYINRLIERFEIDLEMEVYPVKRSTTREQLAFCRAIKQSLIIIRNIEASGKTLADKEREAGVTFDQLTGAFKEFVEDVWVMRYVQKDPSRVTLPTYEKLAEFEQVVDESLAILVTDKDKPANKVLGQEGEDYQLNN